MSHRSFSFDKPEMENEDLRGFNVLFGVTQLTGGLLCLLVLVWGIHFRNGYGWSDSGSRFNLHPLLLTLGMVFLYANSILIFRFLRDMRKKQLKYLHTIIHTVVVLLIIIGLAAIISLHIEHNKPLFRSLHSWVGIVATIIFFLQWVVGLVTYLYPGLSLSWRAAILPLHVYFGIAGFVLAIASCLTGFLEVAYSLLKKNKGDLTSEGVMVNIIGLVFVAFGLLVVYIVTKSDYKRHPRSTDS